MEAGIIGLGLMGGSMGLALKETGTFKTIAGYDANPLHVQQALSLGLVDECLALEEIQTRDVVFLAVPLEGITDVLKQFGEVSPTALIMDVGGAKETVMQSVPQRIRKNFVGTHPMCGTEFYGPKAAQKDLFKNKIVILADVEESGDFQIALAKEIFVSIGMRIVKMNAKDHDKHVALISHLPHVISYALANTVLSREDPQTILALAGGGFKDMSRISKSSPLMWKDVFMQNKANVAEAVKLFKKELDLLENLIENEDWEELRERMANANRLQDFT